MRLKLIAALMALTPVVCSAEITKQDQKKIGEVMVKSLECKVYGQYSSTLSIPQVHANNIDSLIDIMASQLNFKGAIHFRNKIGEAIQTDELTVIQDIEDGIETDLNCTEVNYRAKRIIRLLRDK